MIHITDSQTDVILDDIQEKQFWNDNHRKSLKDNLETFDFTTFADKRFSEHLAKRNRIIIPDEDGKYVEFIIENTRKYRSPQGGLSIEVYTSASYLELIKAKVIDPQTLASQTTSTAVSHAIGGTGWEAGFIADAGIRTLHIEKHTNPYSLLKQIASEFDLELHFRVEVDGNKVIRRYVDLLERVGIWRGREVEFGKDLIGIERKENMANIVTALVGLGPERQDGTRLEVFVEDKDALARWGRNGQHLVEVYEPQSTDQDMTIERLTELTENELEKRVNSVVEYLADIADLEKVPGLEHEKIRFGDTIKIKDTMFNPPLYLEARVHTQERSIKKDGTKKVTLGDYIEHKEEDILAIWRSLQSEIARKVSMSDVTDVVYTKPEVDDRDASVYQDSTYYSDNVSETKKQEAIQVAATDATNKANQAENNAKSHADTVAEQKKQEAIQAATADADAKLEAARNELETDIALKADADWVNGQLVLKADNSTVQDLQNEVSNKADVTWVNNQLVLKESTITKASNAPLNPTINQLWLDTSVTPNVLKRWSGTSWVKATPTNAGEVSAYTKSEVDNALNTKVSVIQYNTDISGIVTDLQSHESRITQNEQEIATKVSQTDYDALEGRVSNAESSIVQNANAIQSKVSQSEFDTLEGRVSSTESTITQHANLIEQKVNQTDYITDKNGIVTQLDDHESRITQTESDIITKVSNTQYQQDKTALEGDISSLDTRMSQAETSITQNANSIALKANSTDVYTKSQVDSSLANKVDNATVNAIEQRVTQAEATLTLQANEIATKVSQTTFTQEMNKKENTVTKSSTAPSNPATNQLWLDTSVIPNVLKRWNGSSWVKATPTTASEVNAYTKSETDTRLNTKANQSELNTLTSRMTNAESSITQLSNEIQLKVSQQDYDIDMDDLTSRMSSAESTLSIHANQISTKVEENGIISAINQTAEQVKIQANRIDFVGAVSVIGTTQLQDTSITNAKIANLAVDDAKIANVSVSKLKAGTINADLIAIANNKIKLDGAGLYVYKNNVMGASLVEGNLTFYDQTNAQKIGMFAATVWSDGVTKGISMNTENNRYISFGHYVNSSTGYNPMMVLNPGTNMSGVSHGINMNLPIRMNDDVWMGTKTIRFGENNTHNHSAIWHTTADDLGLASYGNIGLSSIDSGGVVRTKLTVGRSVNDSWQDFDFHGWKLLRIGESDYIGIGRIIADANATWVQHNSEIRATKYKSTTYVPVRAAAFPTGSLAEYKQDIGIWNESALEKIRNATIYEYRLKSEIADGIYRKRQGLVIGDGYNTPIGVIDGDGVEQYLMNSWSWKAIQELDAKQISLEDDVEWLKIENQYLKQKIEQLEAKVA